MGLGAPNKVRGLDQPITGGQLIHRTTTRAWMWMESSDCVVFKTIRQPKMNCS